MKLTTPVQSFGKEVTEITLRAPIALDLIVCGIPTRVEKAVGGGGMLGVDAGCIGRLGERLGGLAAETSDLLSAPDFAGLIREVLNLVGQPADTLPFPLRAPLGKDIRLCGISSKAQPLESGGMAEISDAGVVARYASVLGGIPLEKVQNLSCPEFLALEKAVTGFLNPTKEEAETSSLDAGNSQGSSAALIPSN